MFGLLTRSRPPANRGARFCLERLEARDCLAAPSITLSVTYLSGKNIVLSGQVTDEHPSGLTVTFSGKAEGTTTTTASGMFSVMTTATGLGTVSAVTVDSESLSSNTAQVTLCSNAPTIVEFSATYLTGTLWSFSGRVSDESPPGLTVQLGGLTSLAGKTATVGADGRFSLTVALQVGESGLATALTTDWWGLESEMATAYV